MVKVPCAACCFLPVECCPHCLGRREVQGFCCKCGMPADVVSIITPFCAACAAPCVLCSETTAAADRVPFGGSGFAHVGCALLYGMGGRFLEGTVGPIESVGAIATGKRSASMPKMSVRTIELMRQRGLITIIEAARFTGTATTTLYERIQRGTLLGAERAGMFHYVKAESLAEAYPHARDALVKAGLLKAPTEVAA
jgi:hypothetical protein